MKDVLLLHKFFRVTMNESKKAMFGTVVNGKGIALKV